MTEDLVATRVRAPAESEDIRIAAGHEDTRVVAEQATGLSLRVKTSSSAGTMSNTTSTGSCSLYIFESLVPPEDQPVQRDLKCNTYCPVLVPLEYHVLSVHLLSRPAISKTSDITPRAAASTLVGEDKRV